MRQALPDSAQIIDVTARDGFQIVKDWIPTETKTLILDQLVAAGVSQCEVASFVSPKAVPQMVDAAKIVAHMTANHPHVITEALVPNMRGAHNAAASGVRRVNCIISASAAHNRENIRRSHEESLRDLAAIAKSLPELTLTLAIGVVFGCPFSGHVPLRDTMRLIEEGLQCGIASVTLADTVGVANPAQVRFVLRRIRETFPDLTVRLHLHDTHGMALANIAAALEEGFAIFETAAGGLGGCPFAPGAAGNVATEDVVNMLHRMGVATNIDLDAYLKVVEKIRETVSVRLPGRLSTARSFTEFAFFNPLKPE